MVRSLIGSNSIPRALCALPLSSKRLQVYLKISINLIRKLVKQDHPPVAAAWTVDQHKRHIRPIFLIDAAVLHLAVERIAHDSCT